MKREDITRILEGASLTDEQVKALLDLNSADITHALGKQKGELEAAQAALKDAQATIQGLEAHKANTEELQKQIDGYREKEQQRQKEAQEAQRQKELETRFNAVSGERRYLHEFVRQGVMADFGRALEDKANLGKSDQDIFAALTRDQNYFAPENEVREMGSVGGAPEGSAYMAEMRQAMGLPPTPK